jgi:hypothetical protein
MQNKTTLANRQNTEFVYGPLNKSLFTQEFELAIKTLLNNPKDVSLKFESNDLHFKLHDIDINMSALLKKVNFSHLEFDTNDSIQYFNIQKDERQPFEALNDLTKAEISAIQNYTGFGYYAMNNLLYGHKELANFESLDSILLKTAFLGSGLNKIVPDHPTLDANTYRGDKPTHDEILERIDLINNGDGLSDTPAFFSTSLSLEVAENFTWNTVIYFDAPYGKDVSGLSYFTGEREYLLEPCTLQWTHYEIKDGMHIFHAKKVEPLIEGKDTPTEHDIATLSKLYEWANSHGVKTDFMTDHLKSVLFKNEKGSDNHDDYLEQIRPQSEKQALNIDLHDCIKVADNIVGLESNESHTLASSPMAHEAHADSPVYLIHMPLTHDLNAASESLNHQDSLC